MAQATIETTDTLPQGRTKINANFTETYAVAAAAQTTANTGVTNAATALTAANAASQPGHTHDDRYYTETEIDTALALKAPAALTINTQTANYTLVLADRTSYVRMNSASALALTVPPNSSVAFAVGAQIPVRAVGAGAVTITAGGGVTINPPFEGTLVLSGQGASAVLVKVATNEWDLTGDTVAA